MRRGLAGSIGEVEFEVVVATTYFVWLFFGFLVHD